MENFTNEGSLCIPQNYPRFKPGSSLPHFPTITYTPKPLTEEENAVLTMLRPYLDDPDTLFLILDSLMAYYHDELA